MQSIVERNKKEASQFYPYITSLSDADQLFTDPSIELVVITTPNDSHFELAYAALQAGKHVIVEKPFTTTSYEAAELIRVGRLQHKMLTVFQSRRFESDFLTVKKIIDSGSLGSIVEYESHFDRFRPKPNPKMWKEERKPGIGLLYDLGSHLVDQALVLFGLPERVEADIRVFREHSKVDDYFFLRLYYHKHIVLLRASSFVKKQGPRFIIHGKEGSFIKYGIDHQEELLKAAHTPDEKNWGDDPREEWGTLYTSIANEEIEELIPSESGTYMNFYQNVFDVIRGKSSLIVKPEQVYYVIRVLELAEESSKCKQSLPFHADTNFSQEDV